MKPIKDYILVKPIKQKESASGLILSEVNPGVITGRVEAIGPKVEEIIPGDIVVMKRFTGVEVKDMLLVKEEEVLAKEDK
jgi:co-chaperonin GroES (HSP10)